MSAFVVGVAFSLVVGFLYGVGFSQEIRFSAIVMVFSVLVIQAFMFVADKVSARGYKFHDLPSSRNFLVELFLDVQIVNGCIHEINEWTQMTVIRDNETLPIQVRVLMDAEGNEIVESFG